MHRIRCICGLPVTVDEQTFHLLTYPSHPVANHIENLLHRILHNQIHIIHQLEREHMDLSRLQNDVESNTTVVDSAVNLIQILIDEVRANAGDEAALNQLLDKFEEDKNRLGQMVAANTPGT